MKNYLARRKFDPNQNATEICGSIYIGALRVAVDRDSVYMPAFDGILTQEAM